MSDRKIVWNEDLCPRLETEPERLRREADDLDQEARRLRDASWAGTVPPWRRYDKDAHDKRLLADLLEKQKGEE